MKIHRTCSTLPIYSFFKAIEENNLKYLIVGYFEEVDEVVVDAEIDYVDLANTFQKIVTEYNSLVADEKSIRKLKAELNLNYLIAKYDTCQTILNLYKLYGNIEIILLLKDFGYKLETEKQIGPQVVSIVKELKGLKNRIGILSSKYKKMYNVDEEVEVKREPLTLDKKCLYLESNLGLSYQIEPRKTTTERFANLINLSNRRLKSLEE